MNTRLTLGKQLLFIITTCLIFSCDSEYDDGMNDKLAGILDVPSDVKLAYEFNTEDPGYLVDFTATGNGQIYYALKKDVYELNPETSKEGVFSIRYDEAKSYNPVLIAQGLKGISTDTIELVIEEKRPFELLATIEVSNDGSGKVKFNMQAQNATSYKVDIYEGDQTNLVFSDVTEDEIYNYLFLNEEFVEVTKNCWVTITAQNGAGTLAQTIPFNITIAAGVAPPETWALFDNMDDSACGEIDWNAVSDETGTSALSELPAEVQTGNNSTTLRYHYKGSGAQYGVLEFRKLADGASKFDFSFQSKFRLKVYVPSSALAPDGSTIDNSDDPDKKIIRLYLENRYMESGSTYGDSYKRNVWIEKEVSQYDQWETLEFDFTNQGDYKYHGQTYGPYKYYIPDGYPGDPLRNPDRLYLRTHINGNASASTIYYFDDFELLDIDGSSLEFICD